MSKSTWMPVSVDGEHSQAAVKSWFSPLCDAMTVESAEILCDNETDREKKIRALMVDKDGKRRWAIRTTGRNYSITLKVAA